MVLCNEVRTCFFTQRKTITNNKENCLCWLFCCCLRLIYSYEEMFLFLLIWRWNGMRTWVAIEAVFICIMQRIWKLTNRDEKSWTLIWTQFRIDLRNLTYFLSNLSNTAWCPCQFLTRTHHLRSLAHDQADFETFSEEKHFFSRGKFQINFHSFSFGFFSSRSFL